MEDEIHISCNHSFKKFLIAIAKTKNILNINYIYNKINYNQS